MAKILCLDIETAPNKVYSWGVYEQNIGINQIIEYQYGLCWCAKWVGSDRMYSDSIINYPSHFKKHPSSDLKIAQSIQPLMEKAHIIVAHNGDEFDIKWLNAMFIRHRLPPIQHYKTVDTKKQIKSVARFVSNKLQSQCRELEIGYKLEHEGFDMWVKCMSGDKRAFATMKKYCKKDVWLVEDLYLQTRPYMRSHPNVLVYDKTEGCITCGSNRIKKVEWAYTANKAYRRYRCLACGRNMRSNQGNKFVLKQRAI